MDGKMVVLSALMVATVFAGCAHPTTDACPTTTLAASAYHAAQAQFDTLRDKKITMQIDGTMGNELTSIFLSLDPDAKRMVARFDATTVNYDGEWYSVVDSDEGFSAYGRDLNPDGAYIHVYNEIMDGLEEDETAGVSFVDRLAVEDYEATCLTRGGVDLYEYVYERHGDRHIFLVEAEAPHRLHSMNIVDPAAQDNYRVSFSYDAPTVNIDTTKPRVSVTVEYEIIDSYTNDRGGQYFSARFTEGTEHAAFTDFEFQLVGTDGTVYRYGPLGDDSWDLDDGDFFEYRDRDRDRRISPGDTVVWDLGPALDIEFLDTWADKTWATWEEHSIA